MADASCGPSNPLQSFQKHTSVDRTLQQDRLASRQSPIQGFRSSAGPQNGLLDAEFEAFQAGQSVDALRPDFAHFQPHHAPHPPHISAATGFAQPSQAPAWASDFQRLQISSPPPQQLHHGPQSQSQGMQRAFDYGQTQQPMQHQPQIPFGYPPNLYDFTPRQMNGQMTPQFEGSVAQGKQRVVEAPEQFDEAAFEAAFDAAHAEALAAEQTREEQQTSEKTMQRDDSNHLQAQARREILESLAHEDAMMQEPEMDSRTIEEYQAQQQEPSNVVDDDELAQTAGRLLDSVADNTSQKFQDSQFLSLMRKLRDKEMRVEGDKMVEASAPAATQTLSSSDPPQVQDYQTQLMLLEQQNKDRLLQSRREHTNREERGFEQHESMQTDMPTEEEMAMFKESYRRQDLAQDIARMREQGHNYEWKEILEMQQDAELQRRLEQQRAGADHQAMQNQNQGEQERLLQEMRQLEQNNLQRRLRAEAEAQAQPETHDEHNYSASADEFHPLPKQTEQQDTDEWRDGRGPLISSDFVHPLEEFDSNEHEHDFRYQFASRNASATASRNSPSPATVNTNVTTPDRGPPA